MKHLLEYYEDIHSPEIKDNILATNRRLKSGSRTERSQTQILQHRYLFGEKG